MSCLDGVYMNMYASQREVGGDVALEFAAAETVYHGDHL